MNLPIRRRCDSSRRPKPKGIDAQSLVPELVMRIGEPRSKVLPEKHLRPYCSFSFLLKRGNDHRDGLIALVSFKYIFWFLSA